jgi:hypothetical protein
MKGITFREIVQKIEILYVMIVKKQMKPCYTTKYMLRLY